ncbi:MAG TPA: hypothetical protein VLC74_03265 [Rhizomicrobium sp.]|nr:hypothetical protein [Rhizomicrobium sp.]
MPMSDITEMGRFLGTSRELRQLVRKAGLIGTWKRTRWCATFMETDSREHLLWWPDTGDLLNVIHVPFASYRMSTLDWRGYRARQKQGAARWTPFFIEDEEFTFPELVFRDAAYFQCGFLDGNDPLEAGMNIYELAEIFDKVTALRIPATYPANSFAVHRFAPNNEYCGFEVTTKPIEAKPQRGTAIVADHISLTAHGEWESPYTQASPVGSFLGLLDVPFDRGLDRRWCEAFFDDEANFLTRNRLPPRGSIPHRDLASDLAKRGKRAA